MQPELNTQSIACPNCSSKNIRKFGKKKAKLQNSQRYQCKECKKIFTLKQNNNKTYPINIILNAISSYNLGYSQTETTKLLAKKFKVKPSQKTVSNWINEYKPICTYNKLRAIKEKPEEMIEEHKFLHNNLPYKFQIHKAKLELLFKDVTYNNQFINQSKYYEPTKSYLQKIPTDEFPHHIFNKDLLISKIKDKIIKTKTAEQINREKEQQEQRASQLKFPYLKIKHLSKNNQAVKLAKLAINLAKSNKDRHNAIQNFFIINDSTTIAVEVPVYLTHDDILYYRMRHFLIRFLEKSRTPITGHIDLLQIRNGLIHILDYKPDAHKKEVQKQAIQQLTIYALALASRTKLDLHSFKCAWFDENNYYEFFPLHTVYPKH